MQNGATRKCRTGSPDIPLEAVTYRMWRGTGPPYVLLDALFMYFFLDKHSLTETAYYDMILAVELVMKLVVHKAIQPIEFVLLK